MKELKYLFKRGFRRRLKVIFTAVLTLGFVALTMIAHEPMGSEDYLFCKIGGHIGGIFLVMLNFMFLAVEITGNRLLRSVPFSRALRTRAVPLYSIIIGGGVTLVIDAAYAVFCVVSGQDMSNLSDMLIVSAVPAFCYIIYGVVSFGTNYGYIMSFMAAFPLMIASMFIPQSINENGFGLPLWAGAMIFAGAFIVGVVLAFVLAAVLYKKSDFKPYQAAIYSQ